MTRKNIKIVLGILPQVEDAGVAVSNLREADFNPQDISILLKDHSIKDNNKGSLQGIGVIQIVDRLEQFGISKDDATRYAIKVREGEALIAITTKDELEETAKEMLEDYHAELVKILPSQ